MSEQERAARIEQLEQEIWQRERELSKLRKADSKLRAIDLLGVCKGQFPDLTLEEIQSWKYTWDDSILDEEPCPK